MNYQRSRTATDEKIASVVNKTAGKHTFRFFHNR